MQIGRAMIRFEIFPLYPWREMHVASPEEFTIFTMEMRLFFKRFPHHN